MVMEVSSIKYQLVSARLHRVEGKEMYVFSGVKLQACYFIASKIFRDLIYIPPNVGYAPTSRVAEFLYNYILILRHARTSEHSDILLETSKCRTPASGFIRTCSTT